MKTLEKTDALLRRGDNMKPMKPPLTLAEIGELARIAAQQFPRDPERARACLEAYLAGWHGMLPMLPKPKKEASQSLPEEGAIVKKARKLRTPLARKIVAILESKTASRARGRTTDAPLTAGSRVVVETAREGRLPGVLFGRRAGAVGEDFERLDVRLDDGRRIEGAHPDCVRRAT